MYVSLQATLLYLVGTGHMHESNRRLVVDTYSVERLKGAALPRFAAPQTVMGEGFVPTLIWAVHT